MSKKMTSNQLQLKKKKNKIKKIKRGHQTIYNLKKIEYHSF